MNYEEIIYGHCKILWFIAPLYEHYDNIFWKKYDCEATIKSQLYLLMFNLCLDIFISMRPITKWPATCLLTVAEPVFLGFFRYKPDGSHFDIQERAFVCPITERL